jgi:hypothetical protein
MANNYFVCLKHGRKYDAEYVNVLHRMVKRNCTLDVEFVCFTEDASGLDKDIQVRDLPKTNVQGWWYKPMFFNRHLGLEGTILFCDLDVIIFENIDKLFTYKPGKFCIIRDFNRCRMPKWNKMNSSVFRLEVGGDQSHVYDEFIKDPVQNSRRFHGDQDWIYAQMHKEEFEFWPDEWIQSYKWEMRGDPAMTRVNGKRNFVKPGEPKILPETSVAVFHGEPNPHNCIDPWCAANWC